MAFTRVLSERSDFFPDFSKQQGKRSDFRRVTENLELGKLVNVGSHQLYTFLGAGSPYDVISRNFGSGKTDLEEY